MSLLYNGIQRVKKMSAGVIALPSLSDFLKSVVHREMIACLFSFLGKTLPRIHRWQDPQRRQIRCQRAKPDTNAWKPWRRTRQGFLSFAWRIAGPCFPCTRRCQLYPPLSMRPQPRRLPGSLVVCPSMMIRHITRWECVSDDAIYHRWMGS